MYLIVGILLGFVAAIPLGPVNAFVISQTMKRDFLHGFLAGVTAAVLDTIYCLIALFGFSLVTDNIEKYQIPLKIVAGLVMLFIGWRLYLTSKKPVDPKPKNNAPSFSPRPLLGVLLLYISNPTLYAFWIWAASWATGHGWIREAGQGPYFFFALACGTGGLIWYTVLTYYVATHHHQFGPRTFQRIFFVLAVFLTGFAVYTFVGIFIKI